MNSRDNQITRRQALCALSSSMALPVVAGATEATRLVARSPLAFNDPIWNREMVARLEADVAPGKFVHGYLSGTVHGVRDGEAVRPLFGFETWSSTRVVRQPDQSYQRMCRELIFYRDIETGKLLDEWTNVYTGERVKVVDVANDPYNFIISEFVPERVKHGSEKPEQNTRRRPLLLKWGMIGDRTVTLERDVHLYYPAVLTPDKWPRESSGYMNRVSEIFRYVIRREDIENPELTHIPYTGVWVRVTPWLPWMLMDGAPGHIFYTGMFTTVRGLDAVPADVAERVRTRYPLYLTAPEAWQEPSVSSLEDYARTQKPAPSKSTK
ncbi:MAG TPA: DUF1838 family protein [Steroidobacter sp.]|uniref:DUF1838 family protein n=1 Tax=Steroidobacter sp. TaxID=1978227 RepID=UPI002ED8E7E1